MDLQSIIAKQGRILFQLITERKRGMNLRKYHMKNVNLTDIDGNTCNGLVYFCDKNDYEAKEDGLEIFLNGKINIFYESDIKLIKTI